MKKVNPFFRWLKNLKDKMSIDPRHVVPLVCFQWGCSEKGDKPDLTSAWIEWGRSDKDYSLYHNGLFFLRLTWPLGFFWGLRWTGKPVKRQYLQTGIGYKLNGQWAFTFRFQNDKSAAEGTWGPNVGQSSRWQCGSK